MKTRKVTHCLNIIIIIGGALGVPVHEDTSETQTPAEVNLNALVPFLHLHLHYFSDTIIHFLTEVPYSPWRD